MADLALLLDHAWHLQVADLTYAPLGFGSHHWVATVRSGDRWFVTVDDLRDKPAGPAEAMRALTAAMCSAHLLRRDAFLSFVLAPIQAADGSVVLPLGGSFAVTLFPFVEGREWPEADAAGAPDRAQVVDLLARLHGATHVVAETTRVDSLQVPARARLEQALTQLAGPWTSGPYAEPTRELLATGHHDLGVLLADYDRRAGELRHRREPWVVTHGEPKASNLLDTDDGPLLVDWDTTLVAPAARDLWMVESGTGDELRRYAEVTGRTVDAEDLATYRMWWDLSEIAEYVRWFSASHTATADSEIAWGGLAESMQIRERWPQLF